MKFTLEYMYDGTETDLEFVELEFDSLEDVDDHLKDLDTSLVVGKIKLFKCEEIELVDNLVPQRQYVLRVETDWDFSLKYRGKVHSDNVKIILNDIKELDEIELLGPHGMPLSEDTKDWEYKEALAAIRADPDKDYNSIGGNRGVCWTPYELEFGKYVPVDKTWIS